MTKPLRRTVCVAWTAGAVLTALLAAGGTAVAAVPRCDYKVSGPQTLGSSLVSRASFRCVTSYPGAHFRVVLQRRVKGHWTTLAQTRSTETVVSGQKYALRASVPCHAALGFTGVMIRTLFALRTHSGRFLLATPADNSLCTFG